jgi:hypothetical protein
LFPLRLGASEGFTHKLENGLNLRIMVYQVAAAYEADGHMHLTVISSRNVKTHQCKWYGDKNGYTRSGVDLPNGID